MHGCIEDLIMDFECGGFQFLSNFDSGNLGNVELVEKAPSDNIYDDTPDYEFNVWTKPDCAGTDFENGNRTWFYFGVKGGQPFTMIKFNIMNLNKQNKMYSQGMSPVYKIVPGRQRWERIKDKPTFYVENHQFILSFKFRLHDSFKTTVYFAFTYPFTYTEQQSYLNSLEVVNKLKINTSDFSRCDDIYYHRELLCHSLENRRIDLITISSYHNITNMREPRLKHLFPEEDIERPFIFINKKIIVLTGRVHPGETPSSFVLTGMINLLVNKTDLVAQALRRNFVFKIIPMLNPDGVFHGNYRTDTRGVNLNRVYTNPSRTFHPSIFGAKSVILYSHFGHEVLLGDAEMTANSKVSHIEDKVSGLSLNNNVNKESGESIDKVDPCTEERRTSELFLYMDMHGHASKKGIFIYGNHFESLEDNIETMLLPKLISINSQHFHFESCNFSEKNMYVRDKRDGSSREGSGRVSIMKSTGLVRSYTLECNYNTGKVLNPLPPPLREHLDKRPVQTLLVPPKYTPTIFEEVGRGILASILDMVSLHPNSRVCNSHHRTIHNVKDWLRSRVIHSAARHSAISAATSGVSGPAASPPSHHLQVRVCLDSIKKFSRKSTINSISAICPPAKRARHPFLPRTLEKKKKKSTSDPRPENRRKKLRPT